MYFNNYAWMCHVKLICLHVYSVSPSSGSDAARLVYKRSSKSRSSSEIAHIGSHEHTKTIMSVFTCLQAASACLRHCQMIMRRSIVLEILIGVFIRRLIPRINSPAKCCDMSSLSFGCGAGDHKVSPCMTILGTPSLSPIKR